jgi:tryptophan synthase alpha chain
MSRIADRLDHLARARRAALVTYIAAGDPTPALTVPLMHAMVEAGCDIIELGVPFSDPMADGPVVQRASERALANGVGLKQVLALVTEFRREDASTPVVLMGYANPIERMGAAPFVSAARLAGVDGVLVVDSPPEECGEFAQALREVAIDPIFLVAPTSTEERIAAIAREAQGYVYYVALRGTTGAKHINLGEVSIKLPTLREVIKVPIGVGFGIRDAASAAAVAEVADAVVVGSRIIEEIERAGEAGSLAAVRGLVGELRRAVDSVKTPERLT